jgi:hypothetical protein
LLLYLWSTKAVIHWHGFLCVKQCSQVRYVILPPSYRLYCCYLPWTFQGTLTIPSRMNFLWIEMVEFKKSPQVIQSLRIKCWGAHMKLLTTMWTAVTKTRVQIRLPSHLFGKIIYLSLLVQDGDNIHAEMLFWWLDINYKALSTVGYLMNRDLPSKEYIIQRSICDYFTKWSFTVDSEIYYLYGKT